MNKFIGIGSLSKNVELTEATNGTKIARFSVAFQRKYKDKNTGKYEADFLNMVAFNNTAEFIHKYFTKGQKMALEGSIQTRSYEANDGTKRYVTEVVVDQAEFVERKADSGKSKVEKLEPINDDTLPF